MLVARVAVPAAGLDALLPRIDDETLSRAALVAPVILALATPDTPIPAPSAPVKPNAALTWSTWLSATPCWVQYPAAAAPAAAVVDRVADWLHLGALKVVLTLPPAIQQADDPALAAFVREVLAPFAADRLVLRLTHDQAAALAGATPLLAAVSGLVLVPAATSESALPSAAALRAEAYEALRLPASPAFGPVVIREADPASGFWPDSATVTALAKDHQQDVSVPIEHIGLERDEALQAQGTTAAAAARYDLGALLAAQLVSDRPDGLFPTVVTDTLGVALGLAYSSATSLSAAVRHGQGVYQSRTRGLWFKGATSGAVQRLCRIDYDCDADALRFTVEQAAPGFCHLATHTCFGAARGLVGLEAVVDQRFRAATATASGGATAPAASYTTRLFTEPGLLDAKIREEAAELTDATTRNDVIWEAADLLYFMLVKCRQQGVGLADLAVELDRRTKFVKRRRGDAKPAFVKPSAATTTATATAAAAAASAKTEAESRESQPDDYTIQLYDLRSPEAQQAGPIHPKAVSGADRAALLQRPIMAQSDIMGKVVPIMQRVRAEGDAALRAFNAQFDRVHLDAVVINAPFPVDQLELPDATKQALHTAYGNIRQFHAAQVRPTLAVEPMPGVHLQRFARPIERVGLYIPGGTAVLPSTALMLGIPAQVAGCRQIVVASPPQAATGTIAPEVMYVAHLVGAQQIVLAGGAHAVAAMAYGTESVHKVDKIFGPGNQFVTAAKMAVSQDSTALTAIDMPAGPSEVLVVADATANAEYVASDLLSQAEHGKDSQVVLVTVGLDAAGLDAIQACVAAQAARLPRRAIVAACLAHSYAVATDAIADALAFSNAYAPEHLILHVADAAALLPQITSAGSVFVGPWSPESCGDYASGTNHALPTYGFARMYSGVSTDSFCKHITSQEITREGLRAIGPTVSTLAGVEALHAHQYAVDVRLRDLENAA